MDQVTHFIGQDIHLGVFVCVAFIVGSFFIQFLLGPPVDVYRSTMATFSLGYFLVAGSIYYEFIIVIYPITFLLLLAMAMTLGLLWIIATSVETPSSSDLATRIKPFWGDDLGVLIYVMLGLITPIATRGIFKTCAIKLPWEFTSQVPF